MISQAEVTEVFAAAILRANIPSDPSLDETAVIVATIFPGVKAELLRRGYDPVRQEITVVYNAPTHALDVLVGHVIP